MKAIILAAGKGTRLGKYTKGMPKCMLKFNGKTLTERQVETLRACEINDITIVKGFMPDKIKISGVKYYTNEDYENTNMVESLFVAENEMDDDLIACYSDILYQKNVIKKVIGSKADIGVTVDMDYLDYWKARFDNSINDTESLVIKDGRIIELGETNCSIEKAKFRYVGIIKFSKKGIEILKKIYYKNKDRYYELDEPWLGSKSFKKAYMTSILQAIINEGFKVKPIAINRGWLEFDTENDYEKYNEWLEKNTMNGFFDFSK